MRVVDKYIGRQVLGSTAFAVGVLSLVLVLGNIFKVLLKELVKRPDMDLIYVVQFILNVLPFSLMFTIPWGLLTAVLLVFGRMSADNELVSLRMAGLSMRRIAMPVFVIAVDLESANHPLRQLVLRQHPANGEAHEFLGLLLEILAHGRGPEPARVSGVARVLTRLGLVA